MEPESMPQQFPFYNELQAIFAARMQRMLWVEAEGGSSGTKKKGVLQLSSDDDEGDNDNDESDGEKGSNKKKKRKKVVKSENTNPSNGGIINGLKEVLEEFMKKQVQLEMQWMKVYEAREEERRMKEMEWRHTMEVLENERIMMERRWREMEEQRRVREEVRAEKRDALITALLNKLSRDDLQ
ncbi:hypothetical protein U1Q18_013576 [Sarracenia purpurea var. burkii]